jgi:hypothetical protein
MSIRLFAVVVLVAAVACAHKTPQTAASPTIGARQMVVDSTLKRLADMSLRRLDSLRARTPVSDSVLFAMLSHAVTRLDSERACMRGALDSLTPSSRDSISIACNGYRYQTMRIF